MGVSRESSCNIVLLACGQAMASGQSRCQEVAWAETRASALKFSLSFLGIFRFLYKYIIVAFFGGEVIDNLALTF